MKRALVKVAVSTLCLGIAAQALAAPLTPSAGSAYMPCTAGTCQVVPSPAADVSPPMAGYTLVNAANRVLTMNNVYTGFTNISIGNVLDVVWRKPAATVPVTATPMCIYGAKVTLTTTDYDVTTAGAQYFDMHDIARGGYATSGNLDVAYSIRSLPSFHPSRVGRTYTSVSAAGLPPFGSTANIDATAADLDSNWVDFTTRAIALTTGSATYPVSAMVYVTAACTTAAPIVASNAIRLRQTIAPFIEISTSGFVPP
jgi:hypothetical protein